MKSLKCEEVLDLIDNREFDNPIVKKHIEECDFCLHYYKFSCDFKMLSKIKDFDLREQFFNTNREKGMSFNLKFASIALAVILMLGSLFLFTPAGKFLTSFYKIDSTKEVDTIEYFYTIASEI